MVIGRANTNVITAYIGMLFPSDVLGGHGLGEAITNHIKKNEVKICK